MELLVLALFVVAAYGVFRLIAKACGWVVTSRYRAFRKLASRYGGRYESRGLADPPIVSFPIRDDLVRVGLAPAVPGRPGPPSTRVVVRFRRGIPFRLELAPADRPSRLQAPKGTRPAFVGDREFDRGFIVFANDVDMAADFLNPAVRWAIGGLQRLAPPGGIVVAVSPERLLVQIDRNLGEDVESLFQAVAEALAIHEGLRAGVHRRLSEGVKVLEDALGGSAEPPTCKVCGEAILEGPVVVCSTCNTPHHRECWEYVGSCSIYGCGGKRARPQDAA